MPRGQNEVADPPVRERNALTGIGKEHVISSLTVNPTIDSHPTGESAGTGSFSCVDCGWQLSLRESDVLPECPQCGVTGFRRDSIFESMNEHGDTTLEFSPPVGQDDPPWLEETRAELPTGSRRLACEEDGEVRLFPIERGWTRIGRSVAADVRLDDPSVSRRHALIVSEPDASLRVLDDRSLNGVFVNGELVEWGKLKDGDRLMVGRYQLFVLEA